MNPFKPAPLPNPLPDLTIEQAQAALNESVARRRHDEEYERMRKEQEHE